MTLVVDPAYRKRSIGSRLVEALSSQVPQSVKAIYLHVLDTNEGAVRFYEANNFQQIKKLKAFYRIESKLCDSYVYRIYINDGKPPPNNLHTRCQQCAFCLSDTCPFVEDIPMCLYMYNNLMSDVFSWFMRKFSITP
eukprot:CAMPEP_0206189246 /NCGR_PEP_ID=MMETSP0166-20121206/4062_1 /ASSEMBLY_ACC=CAM_ASM_000260 /TAXON_ID=95228 /ORGANISM="Vannella robusta, Strain DIVA3 518/3/11/1/6" /LENGTH=136 /DNA_ID=CAMNT_0053605141 /DNA_START=269 /DNA_END=679 /DNA_ORIENTATION=-